VAVVLYLLQDALELVVEPTRRLGDEEVHVRAPVHLVEETRPGGDEWDRGQSYQAQVLARRPTMIAHPSTAADATLVQQMGRDEGGEDLHEGPA
jgi:hypothetical protein